MSAPLTVRDMEKKRKTIVFKLDFPVDVSYVLFTKYSHFCRMKNNKKNEKSRKQQQKNIIIGGYESNGDGFYELSLPAPFTKQKLVFVILRLKQL